MSIPTIDESMIFARVIAPEARLEPAVAAEFLKWGFDDADRQRMSELAAKARAGTLTTDEQAETEEFERVSSLLSIVKSKARRSLRVHSDQ